ncbi:DMT family transporter [Aurantivibrio plasticivorans]
MQNDSKRWQYGLLLSLIASVTWATLPLILKGLLDELDPITTTWFRFSLAGLLLALFLSHKRRFVNPLSLRRLPLALVALCIFGLLSNYVSYIFGLDRITASSSQVLIQCAPMLLLLGGVVIYRERLSGMQWLGVLVFVAGILLFFNQRLGELWGGISSYGLGMLWILVASITWAIYALAQKQALQSLPSANINLFIYLAGTAVLLPFAAPGSVSSLSALGLTLLVLSCANTLIAYGCFAEALNHWEASRVSAILALQPIFTISFMWLLERWAPGYLPVEPLNFIALLGAAMVVFGSMSTALFRK